MATRAVNEPALIVMMGRNRCGCKGILIYIHTKATMSGEESHSQKRGEIEPLEKNEERIVGRNYGKLKRAWHCVSSYKYNT